jgi:hypothetical protein
LPWVRLECGVRSRFGRTVGVVGIRPRADDGGYYGRCGGGHGCGCTHRQWRHLAPRGLFADITRLAGINRASIGDTPIGDTIASLSFAIISIYSALIGNAGSRRPIIGRAGLALTPFGRTIFSRALTSIAALGICLGRIVGVGVARGDRIGCTDWGGAIHGGSRRGGGGRC